MAFRRRRSSRGAWRWSLNWCRARWGEMPRQDWPHIHRERVVAGRGHMTAIVSGIFKLAPAALVGQGTLKIKDQQAFFRASVCQPVVGLHHVLVDALLVRDLTDET